MEPDRQGRLAGGKLLYDRPAEGVHRLRLNNPAKRNALDRELLDGLVEALADLERLEPIELRCLIVAGSGGAFCAGYDISGVEGATGAEQAKELVAHPFTEALDRLERFPAPTVAALEGPTLGGGLELALVCDLRIADPAARLGMPPARLGLVYSHRGLARFVQAIGPARTKELFFRAKPIEAAVAERWGLVNALCEPGRLDQAAVALAEEIAAGAPLSQRGNKRAVNELLAAVVALPADLERELLALRDAAFQSADLREGMAAFFERRTPRWQGR